MTDMTDDDLTRWLREVSLLADVLRRVRLAQGTSQHEVAKFAGLSRSYVSMIESGTTTPERDTLIALLLGGYSLPTHQVDRILLFAGHAPLHHRALAANPLMKFSPFTTERPLTP